MRALILLVGIVLAGVPRAGQFRRADGVWATPQGADQLKLKAEETAQVRLAVQSLERAEMDFERAPAVREAAIKEVQRLSATITGDHGLAPSRFQVDLQSCIEIVPVPTPPEKGKNGDRSVLETAPVTAPDRKGPNGPPVSQ